mmetsp:Transcript_79130/g.211457  ORF Transcript_79130/g.211457 Transcript_79130/m.211457 type:complete len:144 (+) Transcript_79130:120-551(+)
MELSNALSVALVHSVRIQMPQHVHRVPLDQWRQWMAQWSVHLVKRGRMGPIALTVTSVMPVFLPIPSAASPVSRVLLAASPLREHQIARSVASDPTHRPKGSASASCALLDSFKNHKGPQTVISVLPGHTQAHPGSEGALPAT